MNITKVYFGRKFSLGNFEMLELGVEAALNEKDNPLEVWSILSDNAEMWFISQKNKKSAAPQPTVNPLKNESPQTPTAPTQLKWEQMPPSPKGPWEKTTDLNTPETNALYDKLCETGRALFQDGYLYWVLKKDGKVDGLGRRRQ